MISCKFNRLGAVVREICQLEKFMCTPETKIRSVERTESVIRRFDMEIEIEKDHERKSGGNLI